MKAWLGAAVVAASLGASVSARAEPIRILVAASHARGEPGELPLQHAAADVDHVERVLTSLGDFRPENVIRLTDPSAADLDAALDRARALASTHPAGEVTLLFYFSGHGDRDRIHLGAQSVAMSDLADRVRRVPASLRVLVTDACRNYATHSKGITTEPGFAVAGSTSNPADGAVWLFASGEGEPAQESDELRGALFTHYWVSGLRGAGDVNGDGRVTLAESYDFAYSQTHFRSARGSGVLQHPAAVFDLREAAPIVLTRTFAAGTTVTFPRAADAHYLVYALGSKTVLGEVWSRVDREVSFGLPPGRYLIQRRGGGGSAGTEVTLSSGESRALHASDFRAVPEEQLAAKGGEVVLRPNELGVELGVGASRLSSFGELGAVRYARAWERWALSAGLTGGVGTQKTSAENVTLDSVGVDAVLERRWRLGPLAFGAGLGGEADVVWQKVERSERGAWPPRGIRRRSTSRGWRRGRSGSCDCVRRWGASRGWRSRRGAGVLFANFEGTAGGCGRRGWGWGRGSRSEPPLLHPLLQQPRLLRRLAVPRVHGDDPLEIPESLPNPIHPLQESPAVEERPLVVRVFRQEDREGVHRLGRRLVRDVRHRPYPRVEREVVRLARVAGHGARGEALGLFEIVSPQRPLGEAEMRHGFERPLGVRQLRRCPPRRALRRPLLRDGRGHLRRALVRLRRHPRPRPIVRLRLHPRPALVRLRTSRIRDARAAFAHHGWGAPAGARSRAPGRQRSRTRSRPAAPRCSPWSPAARGGRSRWGGPPRVRPSAPPSAP